MLNFGNRFFLPFILVLVLFNTVFFSTVSADNSRLSCAGYSVELKQNSPGLLQTNNLNLDEPQVVAMDTAQHCAVVVWNSDKLSTSQVIFAKDGEESQLDLLDSNETTFWGYSRGSAQNNDAQIHHIMIIDGLDKGAFYRLRTVSRPHVNALPFTSKEIRFVFEDARLNDARENNSTSTTEQQSDNNNQITTPQTYAHTIYNTNNTNNSSYQNKLANLINRHFAPAHSKGKDVAVNISSNTNKTDKTGKENINAQDSNTNIGSTPASSTESIKKDELVDIIGAANASDSLTPLWERIKSFFTGLFTSGQKEDTDFEKNDDTTAEESGKPEDAGASTSSLAVSIKPVKGIDDNPASDINKKTKEEVASNTIVAKGMETLASSSIAAADTAGGVMQRFGFLWLLLPVFLIIAILYYLQKFLSKSYDWVSEKSINFWMASFIVMAVLFMLLRNVALALVFLALFLIALAWHLFNIAISDMENEGGVIEEIKESK